MTDTVRVNGERLWNRLMEIGEIGATAGGGCNRQALTDEDKSGRELFIRWCRAAGCEIRIDQIGNIFARRSGADNSLPPVITGSHLDTQPSGGKFDGVYGVLAGLEVIEALNDWGVETTHPIEVIAWTNEEGCRFDTAMMGSAVWSGRMPLADAYALTDRDGHSVQQELQRIGFLGDVEAKYGEIKAAFELHIEQGPVLEQENKTIGVLVGVQNMSRHRITITGQEAHAGPTPMTMRKDPMMALSIFLPELYNLAYQHAPHGRITFGYINASPGSNNTVPGKLELTVDIRHPDPASYEKMLNGYKFAVQSACDQFDLPVTMDCFWQAPGVEFNEACVEAVRHAVDLTGYTNMEMFSGAGHDACNVSAVVATSMIFIPCKDGLSHNAAEYAEPEHIEAGANVLLQAIVKMASPDP